MTDAGVRKRLARVRRQRIADLEDAAIGRVDGTVELLEQPVLAPLSRRPCVHWLVTIDEVGASDYVERGRIDRGVEFLLRDDSGIARVVADRGEIALGRQAWLRQPFAYLSGVETQLFQQLEIRFNYATTSSKRFNEYVIEPGSTIAVLGANQREPDPGAANADKSGYRGELPTRPVLSSTRRRPLLIGQGAL